jgi:hypothetical protein
MVPNEPETILAQCFVEGNDPGGHTGSKLRILPLKSQYIYTVLLFVPKIGNTLLQTMMLIISKPGRIIIYFSPHPP